MNDRLPKSVSHIEVTLEAPSDSQDSLPSRCQVHLVEGSGPGMSGEAELLLRSRLRSAALLLFIGFSLFLVWHTTQVQFHEPLSVVTYGAHVAVTLILGTSSLLLCSRLCFCAVSMRSVEAVLFGLQVAFFMLLQHNRTVVMVEERQMLPPLAPVWLLLVYTYALYIPNTWRRAAVAIGLMVIAPLVAVAFTTVSQGYSAELLLDNSQVLIEMVLVTAMAAISAIWGVHTINTLQYEAFKARQLGQYKLKQLIGQGGMGEVYLAEHQLMKRPCAIKVIRPEKTGDPRVLARFEREVQATAKLSHWNSVDIFDYGRADDGTFYYVMEFLPGMNLSELVRRFGPLPSARAIHLIRQACDALQEAHGLGLIHRDLKPANIFAASRGGVYDVAKLLDFGLAKPLTNVETAQLTQDGTITGSPLYMSPEQATGDREPDARSDIYSMGSLLYFVLAGRAPFVDDRPLKVLIAHAHEAPAPPSQVNPTVPDDLDLVVMRCLQKNPDDRYQTAAELAAALADCDDADKWTRTDAHRWWTEHDVPRPLELVAD